VTLVVWGRLPEAIAAADAFLERNEQPHACAVARMYRAMACLFGPTATDEALADLRRAVIELDRRGDRRCALIGQANLALFLVYLGRLGPAKAAFDELVVDDHSDAHTRNSVLANRGLLLHELAFAEDSAGDPELATCADESYREGATAFARAGARPYRALVNAHYAMFLFERGELGKAEHTAVECLNEQPDPRTSVIAHAELASIRARRGAIDDARALLREARTIAAEARIADTTVLHGLELHGDFVAMQERATVGVRTREDSTRIRSKLERYATFDVGPFSPRVRMAARLLSRTLDETPSSRRPEARVDWQGSLVVGRDESWLRSPCGEQADLSQRPKLRALVGNLLRRHEEARGRPVPAAELIADVWPDERFVGHAGRTRLHTLVFALRGLGLRDVIQSTPAGYCLDPSLPVVRAEF
jgi:tetratricopeptide (TPR) repeat protein